MSKLSNEQAVLLDTLVYLNDSNLLYMKNEKTCSKKRLEIMENSYWFFCPSIHIVFYSDNYGFCA